MSLKLAKIELEKAGKKETWKPFKDLVGMLNPNFGHLLHITKLLIKDENLSGHVNEYWRTYNDNKQLFKNKGISIESFGSIEEWGDVMRKSLKEQEVNRLLKSQFSNKYKFLLSDKVKEYFTIIVENGVNNHKEVKDLFASKLAAYKNPSQLESVLENIIEELTSNYSIEWVKNKCNRVGGIIVYEDKKTLLVETPIHPVLRRLGSPNWCITRSGSYFNSYVGTTNRQFIIYNFNYKKGDSNHRLGVTTYQNGNWSCGYDDYNSSLYYENHHTIISKIRPLTDDEERERIKMYVRVGYKVDMDRMFKYLSDEEILENMKSSKSAAWWKFRSNYYERNTFYTKLVERNLITFSSSDYEYMLKTSKVTSKRYEDRKEAKLFWLNHIYQEVSKFKNLPFVNVLHPDELYDPSSWVITKIPDVKTQLTVLRKVNQYHPTRLKSIMKISSYEANFWITYILTVDKLKSSNTDKILHLKELILKLKSDGVYMRDFVNVDMVEYFWSNHSTIFAIFDSPKKINEIKEYIKCDVKLMLNQRVSFDNVCKFYDVNEVILKNNLSTNSNSISRAKFKPVNLGKLNSNRSLNMALSNLNTIPTSKKWLLYQLHNQTENIDISWMYIIKWLKYGRTSNKMEFFLPKMQKEFWDKVPESMYPDMVKIFTKKDIKAMIVSPLNARDVKGNEGFLHFVDVTSKLGLLADKRTGRKSAKESNKKPKSEILSNGRSLDDLPQILKELRHKEEMNSRLDDLSNTLKGLWSKINGF